MMMLILAFLVDQTAQLACPLFRAAYEKARTRRNLWERQRVLFFELAFESMADLYRRIIRGIEDFPAPLDTS